MAVFESWQSPATSSVSASLIVSINGFATWRAISTFSARSPQVPSIAEHFQNYGEKVPQALRDELKALGERLDNAR